jgi:hypothetical protein
MDVMRRQRLLLKWHADVDHGEEEKNKKPETQQALIYNAVVVLLSAAK